jgi:hypothetical protein
VPQYAANTSTDEFSVNGRTVRGTIYKDFTPPAFNVPLDCLQE